MYADAFAACRDLAMLELRLELLLRAMLPIGCLIALIAALLSPWDRPSESTGPRAEHCGAACR